MICLISRPIDESRFWRAAMPARISALRAARSASACWRAFCCFASFFDAVSVCFLNVSTLPTSSAVWPDDRLTMSIRASMSLIEAGPEQHADRVG